MNLDQELFNVEKGVFEEGALHGMVLSLVQEIINLPGETHTDQECLWMIHKLVNDWSKLED